MYGWVGATTPGPSPDHKYLLVGLYAGGWNLEGFKLQLKAGGGGGLSPQALSTTMQNNIACDVTVSTT